MAREKFFYNTQTLRYEKAEVSKTERIFKVFAFICAVAVSGLLITVIGWKLFPSPQVEAMKVDNEQLQEEIQNLNSELEKVNTVVDNLQERDANVHRIIFGIDPINSDVWNGGIGGHISPSIVNSNSNAREILDDTKEKLQTLKRQVVLQSLSLDTIEGLARNREDMLASIPSIKPVREDKLKRKIRLLSGFGYRIHPIYKIPKMHTGIDFTAPRGTPIQATGNGVIKEVKKKSTGYGLHVIIDHGFGYKSLYAHMSKVDVKKGQKVVKGQQIGLIGSSGTSTAPHLHYEIIYNGKKVDPINYCLDGLSPSEYEELIKLAETQNQSFD